MRNFAGVQSDYLEFEFIRDNGQRVSVPIFGNVKVVDRPNNNIFDATEGYTEANLLQMLDEQIAKLDGGSYGGSK